MPFMLLFYNIPHHCRNVQNVNIIDDIFYEFLCVPFDLYVCMVSNHFTETAPFFEELFLN